MKTFTVQLSYAAYYFREEVVEAETLEAALDQAVAQANDSTNWSSTDTTGNTFVDALAEGDLYDIWADDVQQLPIPARFSEDRGGPHIIVTVKAKAAKGKQTDAEEAGDEAAAKSKPKSPITSGMRNYLDLHRHAAVRLALIGNPNAALRLLIAHAVASSGNWSVKPDRQRSEGQAIKDSLAASPAQIAFEKEREKVRKLLALPDSGEESDRNDGAVSGSGSGGGDDGTTAQVFARLARLSEANLARVAAFVMAETLGVGSALVETVGIGAGIKPRDHWTPGEPFFALLRDRDSVNAMLAEVAGKKVADKLLTAKLKDQKAALAKLVPENPRWCPGWMRFPATGA